MISIDDITPEEARAELQRRVNARSTNDITPEEARAELQRRGRDIPDINQSQPDEQNRSFFSKLLPNIAAGTAELGNNILGESKREWGSIAPSIAQHIPHHEGFDYPKALGLPSQSTMADDFIRGLAENSLLALSPAGELGLAGKAIKAIPKVGEFLASAASRIAPQAAFGALSSEDPSQGAKHAALVQALMEAVPGAGKVIGAAAEKINPMKAAESTVDDIKSAFASAKERATSAYQPFNEIAGQFKFEGLPPNFKETLEETAGAFTPAIKRIAKKFIKDPTLDLAHKLQSQMFTDANKVVGDIDKKQSIEFARKALLKDIDAANESISPHIAESYRKGANIHKNEIRPFLSNPELETLVTGETKNVKPKRIESAITKAIEEGNIPEGHHLRSSLEDIGSKIKKGEIYQYGIPAALGAGMGATFGHHGIPIGLGLGAGALGGMGFGHLAELAQNPEFLKELGSVGSKLKKYGQPLIRGIAD